MIFHVYFSIFSPMLVSIFWHVFYDTEGGVEDVDFAAGLVGASSKYFV